MFIYINCENQWSYWQKENKRKNSRKLERPNPVKLTKCPSSSVKIQQLIFQPEDSRFQGCLLLQTDLYLLFRMKIITKSVQQCPQFNLTNERKETCKASFSKKITLRNEKKRHRQMDVTLIQDQLFKIGWLEITIMIMLFYTTRV